MRTRSLATAAVAAALLLAGCSGDPGGGASTSASPSSAEVRQVAALRAVSDCIRAHGYPNFPDASQQADGTWNWPSSYNSTFRAATPCRRQLDAAKALMGARDRQRVDAATLAKLRGYARCMREHGIADWPDPTPIGTFKLPLRFRPAPGQDKAATQGKFAAQHKACESLAPEGGVSFE